MEIQGFTTLARQSGEERHQYNTRLVPQFFRSYPETRLALPLILEINEPYRYRYNKKITRPLEVPLFTSYKIANIISSRGYSRW